MSLINKTGFMQNNHKTLCKPIIEQVAQIILQEFVELNVVCLFQERTSPTSKVGSLWTSTSSLGFPGGSLGHLGAAGAVMFVCRPLRPYLDLVV